MPAPAMPDTTRKRIAIIGTGLSGLVTAHLLHPHHDLTLFESGPTPSLDAGSLPHPTLPTRLDLPMRSFTPGYYPRLTALLTHLRLPAVPQHFTFTFTAARTPTFSHPSAFHRLPQKPPHLSTPRWLATALLLLAGYLWFCTALLLLPPRDAEPLAAWLSRTRIPRKWAEACLLPLMCAVSTCAPAALLAAPASDVTEYKRRSWGQRHYVVRGGVQRVQARLLEGVAGCVRYNAAVREVRGTVVDGERFDAVVFAVAPDVVARVAGGRVGAACARLRTREVVVEVRREEGVGEGEIVLRGHAEGVEAVQGVGGGVVVVTDPEVKGEGVRRVFTRVLRSMEGREVVRGIWGAEGKGWRNGEDGVWVVGGWCWDGLVLLEGCVRSAEAVARALGAEVPW